MSNFICTEVGGIKRKPIRHPLIGIVGENIHLKISLTSSGNTGDVTNEAIINAVMYLLKEVNFAELNGESKQT